MLSAVVLEKDGVGRSCLLVVQRRTVEDHCYVGLAQYGIALSYGAHPINSTNFPVLLCRCVR